MKTVDLRSDTVTRPTPAMREAMRRRWVTTMSSATIRPSTRCRAHRRADRQTGRALHALGYAEQPVRHPGALRSRRQYLVSPVCAHLPLRGAAARRSSATSQPDGTGGWRSPISRPPCPTIRISRAPACSAWKTPGTAMSPGPTWPGRPRWPGRGPPIWTARASSTPRSPARCQGKPRWRGCWRSPTISQPLGLLQQGAGRSGRLGLVRLARADRRGAALAQDGWRRHARQAGLLAAAACTRSITMSSVWQTTTRWRSGSRKAWPASGTDGALGRHQHCLRRCRRRTGPGAARASPGAWRARRPACSACASSPTSMSMRPASVIDLHAGLPCPPRRRPVRQAAASLGVY